MRILSTLITVMAVLALIVVTAFQTATGVQANTVYEGCTPGFWKQPQHYLSWVTYSSYDSYDTVFGVDSYFGGSLLQALKREGGGEAAFGRHAAAAMLNSTNPDISYKYDEAEVIDIVQAAYSSGYFEEAKDLFEEQNELGWHEEDED